MNPEDQHTLQTSAQPNFTTPSSVRALVLMCGVVLSVCAVQSTVHAQAATVSEGGGLGTGNLRLSPSLSLEGGYDSNVFFEDEQELPTDSFLLNAIGKLGVFTARPNSVYFESNLSVTYQQFLNSDERVSEQSGVALNGDVLVTFNPNGAVAFSLYDNAQRTNEAPNSPNVLSYNRIRNTAGAKLHIQPGGKLLTLDIGGSYTVDRNAILDDLDRDMLGFDVQGNWKFLPKTALLARYDQRFITYKVAQREPISPYAANLPSELLNNVDSTPFTLETGVSGLVTDRVSVILLGGYTDTMHASGDSFTGFTGRFEGSYELSAPNRFTLGYSRSAQDSSFGNFIATHSFYSRYNHLVGSLVNLDASVSYDIIDFSTISSGQFDNATLPDGTPASNFPSSRSDGLLTASLGATFQLFDIWRFGARYQADVNNTDFDMITAVGSSTPSEDINLNGVAVANYTKHRFFLNTGVEW